MRNTPRLPIAAIVLAIALGALVAVTQAESDEPLSELELGWVAWSVGLAVYGVQGLISVVSEGRELRPGRMPPRLTDLFSLVIVILSLVLFGIAVFLVVGLTSDWDTEELGLLAGGGCLVLALLLVFYKEAFVGDEATLDSRDDGIPW